MRFLGILYKNLHSWIALLQDKFFWNLSFSVILNTGDSLMRYLICDIAMIIVIGKPKNKIVWTSFQFFMTDTYKI